MSNLPIDVITIAGFTAGIKVKIRRDYEAVFNNMVAMAKNGNHWARIATSELQSLSSGHMKKSVFHTRGADKYTMVLPGCEATFCKHSKGEYYIESLVALNVNEVVTNYSDLQKNEEKPGLFNVTKSGGKWIPTFIQDGCIKDKKVNTIVVADHYEEVKEALVLADDAATDRNIMVTASDLSDYGFDLHFTPGEKRIGGVMNLQKAANADTDPVLRESATLLASTMKDASKYTSVKWISERGGSGVLTHAMHLLKAQGVSFQDKKHKVFFSHITTNLVKAEQLARDIGLELGDPTHTKDFINVNQMFGSGLGSGFVAIYHSDKEGKFSAYVEEIKSHKDLAMAGKAAIENASTAYSTWVASIGAITLKTATAASAFSAAYAFGAAAMPVIMAGNSVAKSYFPSLHKKAPAYLKKLIGKS